MQGYFDEITRALAEACNAPVSMLSLIGADWQWVFSEQGLGGPRCLPRCASFCAYTILEQEIFIVEDALRDHRFLRNTWVNLPPYLRFYAGAPVKDQEDFTIGALCVADVRSRTFNTDDETVLFGLAGLVSRILGRKM